MKKESFLNAMLIAHQNFKKFRKILRSWPIVDSQVHGYIFPELAMALTCLLQKVSCCEFHENQNHQESFKTLGYVINVSYVTCKDLHMRGKSKHYLSILFQIQHFSHLNVEFQLL